MAQFRSQYFWKIFVYELLCFLLIFTRSLRSQHSVPHGVEWFTWVFSTFALLDDLLIFHRWIFILWFSLPDTVQQQYSQHSDQQSGRLPSGRKRSMDHQGTMLSANSRPLLQVLHNIHNLPYGSTFILRATRRFFGGVVPLVGNERFSNMAGMGKVIFHTFLMAL